MSGSWWDKQLRNTESRALFEREEQDLFRDFRDMPRGAALRWEIVKTSDETIQDLKSIGSSLICPHSPKRSYIMGLKSFPKYLEYLLCDLGIKFDFSVSPSP